MADLKITYAAHEIRALIEADARQRLPMKVESKASVQFEISESPMGGPSIYGADITFKVEERPKADAHKPKGS